MTSAVISRLSLLDLLMPLDLISSSGKMSPASSPTRLTPSDAYSGRWPEKMARSSRQGENGRTLVMCADPGAQSHGGSLTPSISDWPNDAAVCSLSQVLETGSIPQRYFLSSTASAGILHRAEKRGKKLPALLEHALQAVAASVPTLNAREESSLLPSAAITNLEV